MADLRIEKVRDMTGVEAVADEWDACLARSRLSGNVFASSEWVLAWWTQYGTGFDPCILLARKRESGELAAILPLFARRVGPFRGLELIGKYTSNGLDMVLPMDNEAADRVCNAFIQFLSAQRSKWDFIYNFVTDFKYGGLPLLTRMARSDGLPYRARENSTIHYVDITGVWDDFLQSKSRNFRQQMGKKRRRIERELSAVFRKESTGLNAEELIRICRQIDAKSWKAEGGKLFFSESEGAPFFRQVFPRIIDRGWLETWFIDVDDKPIAYIIVLCNGENSYFYRTGYDETYAHYSPGLCIYYAAVENQFELGRKRCSFMLGDEPYKDRFATETVPRQQLYLFSPTLKGRLLRTLIGWKWRKSRLSSGT